MTNCSGTQTNCCNGASIPSGCCPGTTTTTCFSSASKSINKANCGCTPCDTPIVINQGDVSNQVLVPVLADVIQNCMSIGKYETAYPSNLVIQTDLLKVPTGVGATPPSGAICITGVSYSYDCLGVASDDDTPATISAYADSTPITLTGTTPSCSCTDTVENDDGTTTTTTTTIYNEFAGIIKTNNCCCKTGVCSEPVAQPYAQTKLVETALAFSFCNLSISVTGTIGCQPFTGTVSIPEAIATRPLPITPLASGLPVSALGFPGSINFAGRMCLPTNTRINIEESFDNCMIVDCIRPVNATYSTANDPTNATTGEDAADATSQYATFTATGDLSLVLNKNIYAITPQKLAVITNYGAQVVCNDGNMTIPSCPKPSCTGATQCPSPARPAADPVV